MDWLRNKIINNWKKKHRSESEDQSATEIVKTWVGNGWLLSWPEPWVGHWILESSFMSWLKARWKYESDYVYCPVIWKLTSPRVSWLLATELFNWFVLTKFFTNASLPFVAKWMAVLVAVLIQLKIEINLRLYTDFSRSNHHDTEWKRSSMWEWCYITWYRTRAELWWWHTER